MSQEQKFLKDLSFQLKFDEDGAEIIESEEEEEEEEVVEFVPGWQKREEDESDVSGVTEKGLPTRDKWQTGIVAFAHDAYQPQPTKTGAYAKLKKNLKKKNDVVNE